jgi:hypothetical protein
VLKYSYLSPLIYICYTASYVILFYFTFFMCFLLLQVCGRKGVNSRNSDLKSKKEEKMESEEAIVRRRSAIEHIKGNRTHLCVMPPPAAALFWKFLILGFWPILVAQGFNLTRFRVSRILLDSINRPVNIEFNTRYFGRRIDCFQGNDFPGLFFSSILFYEDD